MREDIAAIPTTFMGCRFRSRLEARWAIAMYILGIEWEYEPEGFNVGLPTGYLPDFRIQKRFWAEVKPTPFNGLEREKAERIVEHTGKPLVMLVEQINFVSYEVLSWEECDRIGRVVSRQALIPADWTKGRFWFEPTEDEINSLRGCPRYSAAVAGSRAARFEFGEEGL